MSAVSGVMTFNEEENMVKGEMPFIKHFQGQSPLPSEYFLRISNHELLLCREVLSKIVWTFLQRNRGACVVASVDSILRNTRWSFMREKKKAHSAHRKNRFHCLGCFHCLKSSDY